ncbi:MAG: cytochrome b/b6 domain-containing protein [Thermodesulfobacteriota bacterium]
MGYEGVEEQRVMVDVWDWQTRVLHWVNALLIISLVLLMLGNEVLGDLGVAKALRRPIKETHVYLGYIFLFTFSLRIFWAFAGNRYARWGDIIPYMKEKREAIARNIRWYLGGLRGRPARVAGHDPLASLFYIAVFLVLASQIVTGLVLAGAEFRMFPGTIFTSGLSEYTLEPLKHSLEEFHEFGFWVVLIFLGAHLAGLVVHEVKEKTGLLSSMVHGRKYFPEDEG